MQITELLLFLYVMLLCICFFTNVYSLHSNYFGHAPTRRGFDKYVTYNSPLFAAAVSDYTYHVVADVSNK